MNKIKLWYCALCAGPGPKNRRETFILFIKGVLMGAADIIPGVSGGTVAFISGIYSQLVDAIDSINGTFFKQVATLKIEDALRGVHTRFLFPLFFGIALSIITLARLMHYLIKEQALYTWSLFFGLLAASVLILAKEFKLFNPKNFALVAIGAVSAYNIVSLIPVQTPDSLAFIFFCGAIAICAMILPGLSGAFLLLILGKYEVVTGALKNPFIAENAILIGVFILGCLTGLLSFSKALKHLLANYYTYTMSLLCGFLIGAMKKIWPYKEILKTKTIGTKEIVIAEINTLPATLDSQVAMSITLGIIGFVIILVIEKKAAKDN